MDEKTFFRNAGHVTPSPRQLAFLQHPFYAFVHFTVNTYTNLEWGLGTEDPAIFNPVHLDCDAWVDVVKSAGMDGLVLTAKHHDGFCLWPSRYTEHCVRNSPWKDGRGDVVREAAEACRRGGIRFGFYLSPWDRNSSLYGTDAYNDYYKAQLTELLTNYGDIFYVWFDGACGEGPNGKKQEYDFDGYIELIRKYQPDACIFNDFGPDIRWVGNESGTARESEWMVGPHEHAFRAEQQTHGALASGTLDGIYNTWPSLGGREIIRYSEGLSFAPAETDLSIRPGWFYHPGEEPHSLERLMRTYITSVGGSTTFNLNIPPMPDGRFDPRDVRRLKELGKALEEAFGHEVAPDKTVARTECGEMCLFHVVLPEETDVRYVTLGEDISEGQRVERFMLTRKDVFGKTEAFFHGTTIGNRRICDLGKKQRLQEFDIRILSSRDTVETLSVRLT